jgi:hypothetical protein
MLLVKSIRSIIFPNLRVILQMLGMNNGDDEAGIPVKQPFDSAITQVNKRGSVCDGDDPYHSIGGICVLNMQFQTFYRGLLQQEIVGREWWIRMGPLFTAPGGKWRDKETRKKYWQPNRRTFYAPLPPPPNDDDEEEEKK